MLVVGVPPGALGAGEAFCELNVGNELIREMVCQWEGARAAFSAGRERWTRAERREQLFRGFGGAGAQSARRGMARREAGERDARTGSEK